MRNYCIRFPSSPPTTPKATPIATKTFPALPPSFFARPAEQVAPDLIGCLLVKRQPSGELLWGVIVETEAYFQEEPACHGYRRRYPTIPAPDPPMLPPSSSERKQHSQH